MNTPHRIAALPLSVLVLSLVACADKSPLQSAQMQTAQIMKEDKSQIALLLNKNLSVSVAGVEAGMRAKPCATDPNYKAGAASKAMPTTSYESCRSPDKPKGEIFYQQTYTVTVVKGSCCAYISVGGNTYELCSGPNVPPDFPVEFINSLTGQSCPDGQ